MSWIECPDPIPGDTQSVDAIEGVIIPRTRDVDGARGCACCRCADYGVCGQ